MDYRHQLSTSAAAGGSQQGSGLRRIACLAALLFIFVAGARADAYRLFICGVQVTDDNKNSLSDLPGVNQGTITFDGTNLTLSGVSIDVTGQTAQGITLGQSDLTLTLMGTNTIKGDYAGIKVTADATITGTGSLDIEAKQQGIFGERPSHSFTATLTITGGCQINCNSDGYGITGTLGISVSDEATVLSAKGTLGSISDVSSIYLSSMDGLKVVEPKGAKLSSGGVVDENGNVVKGSTVTICKAIAINEANFPDEDFRKWVIAQKYGADSILTKTEIAAVTKISVSWGSAASLKGIEYFTALKELDCHNNQLASLDVSKNTALTRLFCYGNQLATLEFPENAPMVHLDCSYNQLTSLDVSGCTGLTSLDCSDNQLTSLKVSDCTALTKLTCNDNQLTALNVSSCTGLTSLDCSDNQLTELDVSGCTALTSLDCTDNQLAELGVSDCTALTTLKCYLNEIRGEEMAALVSSLRTVESGNGNLQVRYKPNYNIVVGPINPGSEVPVMGSRREKSTFDIVERIDGNQITVEQVEAANNKGWNVRYNNNGDYSGYIPENAIDATNFPDENFRNYVANSLDADRDGCLSSEEIASMTIMSISSKNIASLTGIEYFTALKELYCDGNQLEALDVSKNTALTRLICSGNKLSTLNVSDNTVLTELYCDGNQLEALDVSNNKALTGLACCGNQIRGKAMATLISRLPTVESGYLYVFAIPDDGNVITPVQVQAAEANGWSVLAADYTNSEGFPALVPYSGKAVPGDANGDGEVNATDVDCLRSYILGLDPKPFSLESANLNGDSTVDIADLTKLIEKLKE